MSAGWSPTTWLSPGVFLEHECLSYFWIRIHLEANQLKMLDPKSAFLGPLQLGTDPADPRPGAPPREPQPCGSQSRTRPCPGQASTPSAETPGPRTAAGEAHLWHQKQLSDTLPGCRPFLPGEVRARTPPPATLHSPSPRRRHGNQRHSPSIFPFPRLSGSVCGDKRGLQMRELD